MPRDLSPALAAAVASAQQRPALFVKISFLTEDIYLWGGFGPCGGGTRYSDSATFPYSAVFQGIGWLGQIQSIPQVADVIAQNIALTLPAIPTELLTDAMNAVRQNSTATVWLGMLDGAGHILPDPEQVFQGALDVPSITEGAVTSALSITVENPLIDLNRAPLRRYTDIDQQLRHPGDLGFFQVQLLQDYGIVWPQPWGSSGSVSPPNYIRIDEAPAGGSPPLSRRVGQTLQLHCTETRSDGSTHDVTALGGPWFSSDDGVARVGSGVRGVQTIPDGLVTAVAPGFCNIVHRFQEGMFLGSGSTKPSGIVEAAVSLVVTP